MPVLNWIGKEAVVKQYLKSILPYFDGEMDVYGAGSPFDKTKLAITFHQLPYDLAVKTWF